MDPGTGTEHSRFPASRRFEQPVDPFAVLAERLGRYQWSRCPGLPPFQGGAAGLFGYDLCHHLERLPRPPVDEFEVPDLAVGLYDWVVAFDHLDGASLVDLDRLSRDRAGPPAAASPAASGHGETVAPRRTGWRCRGTVPGRLEQIGTTSGRSRIASGS